MSKKIEYYDWCNASVTFTKKQMDVIYHTINGRTAKQAAIKMYISHRTVQAHIDNVERKLGCHHKNEIISKVNIIKFLQNYQENSHID